MADNFNTLDSGGGGGITYSDDGFVAQQGNHSVDANTSGEVLTYIASLPDSDGNVTEEDGTITVNTDGFYAVSVNGYWDLDDSVETGDRIIELFCDSATVPNPAAKGIYAYAAKRWSGFTIIPNAGSSDHTCLIAIDFVAPIGAGTQFALKVTNSDPTEASQLKYLSIGFNRIGG